jgi:hypothetical protein
MSEDGRTAVSNTRFKLQEAEYFFDQMKKNVSEKNHFIFNLIAFVSAGRSVTFVMQDEYTIKVGTFAKWYSKNVDEALRKEEVPRFFRNLRNVVLKQKGNPMKDVRELVFRDYTFRYDIIGSPAKKEDEKRDSTTSIPLESSPLPEQPQQQTEPQPQPQYQPTITDNSEARTIDQKYIWYIPDIHNKKKQSMKYVIPTCEEYLQRLRGIVNECEKLFN